MRFIVLLFLSVLTLTGCACRSLPLVTAESSPDRGSTSYTVDKAGNITQRTDTQDEEAAESAKADSTSQAASGAPMPEPDDEDDEHAPEKTATDIAKQIEKDLGKDARRKFHDAKRGRDDRSLKQLKEDAQELYEEAGKPVPKWLK